MWLFFIVFLLHLYIFCSFKEVDVAFLRGVKTFWHGHCSNVYLTLKQRFCILVLPLQSHPPLCLCICNKEARSQMWKRKICSCPIAWPLMTTSKWGAQSSDFFYFTNYIILICQIAGQEIISLPVNSTQSESSVKQTNDVKNENCNKLPPGPIITRSLPPY